MTKITTIQFDDLPLMLKTSYSVWMKKKSREDWRCFVLQRRSLERRPHRRQNPIRPWMTKTIDSDYYCCCCCWLMLLPLPFGFRPNGWNRFSVEEDLSAERVYVTQPRQPLKPMTTNQNPSNRSMPFAACCCDYGDEICRTKTAGCCNCLMDVDWSSAGTTYWTDSRKERHPAWRTRNICYYRYHCCHHHHCDPTEMSPNGRHRRRSNQSALTTTMDVRR